jgi:hypothetical protein
MTVTYSITGTPTGLDSLERLKKTSRESSLITQRIGRTRTRMWAVVMGGNMTGKFTWTMDFASAEAALAYQTAFDADPESQDFVRRTMGANAPVLIDNIDLLTEVELGTGAETTTPSAGMAVMVQVKPGGLTAAVAALAKGSPLMRDLGCTSHRLLATGVGASANNLVVFTEFPDLAGAGKVMDVFNDPLNHRAQEVRAPLDAPDTPVLNLAVMIVQEIAY